MIMVNGKNIALAGGLATVIGVVLFYGTAIFGALADGGSEGSFLQWVILTEGLIGFVGFEVLLVGIILWARDRKKQERSDAN
jgi:hypothetical protein